MVWKTKRGNTSGRKTKDHNTDGRKIEEVILEIG